MLPIPRGVTRPVVVALLGIIMAVVAGCTDSTTSKGSEGKKRIVVTYSILGSLVKDVVGDRADVVVMMPNGADPHEWERGTDSR